MSEIFTEDAVEVMDTFHEFIRVKDELLIERGMVTIKQVLDEYLRRNPTKDREFVTGVITNVAMIR